MRRSLDSFPVRRIQLPPVRMFFQIQFDLVRVDSKYFSAMALGTVFRILASVSSSAVRRTFGCIRIADRGT